MQSKEKTAPLPSIWATIAAGFDVTAKHFWLILIPVLLDVFLWLGPRLSLRLLIARMAEFWQQETAVTGLNVDLLLELAPRTNLFTSLSLPILGVPALMVGLTPEKTPLATTWIELDSAAGMVLLFILFTILGLVLTAVYMTLTSAVIRQQPLRQAFKRLGINWLKLVGLILLLFIFAVIVYFPVVIIGMIAALISEALASIIILMGPVLVLWLAVYLFFTPHGIFVNGRSLLRAMLESLQMMRLHLLPSITLLLTILLIGRTVDWLLLLADDGSWLTGFSLIGHAFVSTALLAATFIFYRDRHARIFNVPETVPAENGSIGRSNLD
jgi:hypothetical protein